MTNVCGMRGLFWALGPSLFSIAVVILGGSQMPVMLQSCSILKAHNGGFFRSGLSYAG